MVGPSHPGGTAHVATSRTHHLLATPALAKQVAISSKRDQTYDAEGVPRTSSSLHRPHQLYHNFGVDSTLDLRCERSTEYFEMSPWRSNSRNMRAIQHLMLGLFAIVGLYKFFTTFSQPSMPQSQSHPVVGKVTMIYGNHSIYERGFQTHQEHGLRHGYPISILRRPIVEGTFNKYAALLSEMLKEMAKSPDERLQWLLWFDSDTVLMNPNMPLETFLPPSHLSHIHLLLSKDWNGMNNGVFFIRVNEWSIALLSAAMSYPILNPDVPLFWPDQSALTNLLNEHKHFKQSVVYCPLRWFNAYMRSPDGLKPNPDSPSQYQVHPGDLLVHFPGTPGDHLTQTLTPYIDIAESHRPEWEPNLAETEYEEETTRFWNKVKVPKELQ